MNHGAALRVLILMLALFVRAASAQPFAPSPAPGYAVPPQGGAVPPDNLRYPLPAPSAPTSLPPAPAVVPSQALRYPLPSAPPLPPPQGSSPAGPGAVPAPPAAPAAGELFQAGVVVAQVGNRSIFYGDVAPIVNMIMDPYLSKAKSAAERAEIEGEREALTKNIIRQVAQDKMMYLEFDREMRKSVPDPKKFAEAKAGMDKRIRGHFEKALLDMRERLSKANPEETQKIVGQQPTVGRLAMLMKERRLESMTELDLVLRQMGTSLDQQTTAFGEHILGMESVRKHIPAAPEVTHEEMLDYYREHATDYALPARARFQILTAKFANFPTRREALDLITQMGNAVYLGGTPLDAVAKKFSQEPNAAAGGYYDWVNQGSLASKVIDQAVFSLELDRLSQIIEDDTGYHIVRVKERQPAGFVSFIEAQPEIKEALAIKKRMAEQQEYLKELQARTTIWTIYDQAAAAGGAAGANRR